MSVRLGIDGLGYVPRLAWRGAGRQSLAPAGRGLAMSGAAVDGTAPDASRAQAAPPKHRRREPPLVPPARPPLDGVKFAGRSRSAVRRRLRLPRAAPGHRARRRTALAGSRRRADASIEATAIACSASGTTMCCEPRRRAGRDPRRAANARSPSRRRGRALPVRGAANSSRPNPLTLAPWLSLAGERGNGARLSRREAHVDEHRLQPVAPRPLGDADALLGVGVAAIASSSFFSLSSWISSPSASPQPARRC